MGPEATNALGAQILSTARRIAHARWGALSHFFGEAILRHPHTFPPVMAPREPLAPGFRPVEGAELFASAFAEVDVALAHEHGQQAIQAAAESQLDLAAFRIEAQVRESMRGKIARGDVPAIPPAIILEPGDRIYPAILAGASYPAEPGIRVRIQNRDRSSVVRIDLELLLVKASAEECVQSAAARIFDAVAPVVHGAVDATSYRDQPARLLIDTGTMLGRPCTVLVGIGDFAAERVKEAGQQIAADLPAAPGDDQDDDGDDD